MRFEKTRNQMKKIPFAGLEKFDIYDSLYFCYYDNTYNRKELFISCLRIIKYLFVNDVEYSVDGLGKIAFIYSNSYKNRRDHFTVFNKLVSLFTSKSIFLPGKRQLNIRNLYRLPKVISWFTSLHKEFSLKESVYYASMVLFGVNNAEYIRNKINNLHCEKIIVFSDMNLIDSILVQMCNDDGIITATLQHGNFELDEPFVLSKSNYFITYGKYSKNKAVSFGMQPERIIEAGMLKFLGSELPKKMEQIKEINAIGVILSGGFASEEDTKLVNMISSFCQEHGIRLLVKLHPEMIKEDYKLIEWNKVDEIHGREISVDDFRHMIDAAVLLNSTVYFEYVMNLFPIFIFQEGKYKLLENEAKWCSFSSIDEFESLLNNLVTEPEEFEKKMKEMRLYISNSENIAESYKSVINKLSSL